MHCFRKIKYKDEKCKLWLLYVRPPLYTNYEYTDYTFINGVVGTLSLQNPSSICLYTHDAHFFVTKPK